MQIKIGKVPGRTQVLELQEGATIADAVRQAGLDVTGHELRFNGMSTEDFNKEVVDGAIVLLTPRIKGNSDYISVTFKEEEYTMQNGDTLRKLLSVSGWEDYIEEDEVVAIKKDGEWVAVNAYDKLINWAAYDIVNKADVTYPTVEEGRTSQVVNISESDNGEVARVIVGDLEIVINKVR